MPPAFFLPSLSHRHLGFCRWNLLLFLALNPKPCVFGLDRFQPWAPFALAFPSKNHKARGVCIISNQLALLLFPPQNTTSDSSLPPKRPQPQSTRPVQTTPTAPLARSLARSLALEAGGPGRPQRGAGQRLGRRAAELGRGLRGRRRLGETSGGSERSATDGRGAAGRMRMGWWFLNFV